MLLVVSKHVIEVNAVRQYLRRGNCSTKRYQQNLKADTKQCECAMKELVFMSQRLLPKKAKSTLSFISLQDCFDL